MKTLVLILNSLFFLLPLCTKGQQENLIYNGSLEEYINCPFSLQILNAKGWSAGIPGSNSSTDYFHACAGTVPAFSSEWIQNAASGEAYFGAGNGLGNLDSTAPQSREFASGKLKLCLEAGRRYQLSFYVSSPARQFQARRGYDCFEVYFHPNEFPLDGQNLGVSNRFYEVASEALRMPVNGPIVERGIWHKLEITFTAQGNECYFTVGCFKWLRPENIGVLVGPGVDTPLMNGIYYLYDDFVLTEIPEDTTPEPTPEPVVPNVLTPNGDGINDFWVIENLPSGTTVAIYNRWGQRVYFSPAYANNWAGEGLPAGNYIAELVFRNLPPRRLAIYLKRE